MIEIQIQQNTVKLLLRIQIIVINRQTLDVVAMSKEELIEKTDNAISELVYDKYELQRAYNYYNGKRDADQFRYIEENFGIGNPTSVEFIPLIRKHIDALIGEYKGELTQNLKWIVLLNRPQDLISNSFFN